jgi:hypothetical protein
LEVISETGSDRKNVSLILRNFWIIAEKISMLSDKSRRASGRTSPVLIGASARQGRIANFADTPATRRQFIASLLAGAGSLALAACGGGGGGTAAGSSASSLAQGSSANPPGAATPSAPGTSASPAASNAAASDFPLFYGMNGHMAWPTGVYSAMTAAQQLAILQDLGVTNYRADVAGSGMAQIVANALTGAFKGSGVSILPCINPNTYDQTASETTAYNLGYQLAVSIATPLKGLVSYIECGNELDASGLISNGAGDSPANYNPEYWPAFRGVLRGMIDGVKAIDPTIKCGINVGVPLAYGALQMLWKGQTPNGTATPTSGATSLHWDVTMYHWYESSGDITRAGPQGLINVLQILKQSFNLPIWLTEWGFQLSDSSATQSTYVTNTLGEYFSLRETYNLQSVMMYELIDMSSSDTYGLIEVDGITHKPCYTSFKSYTASNQP